MQSELMDHAAIAQRIPHAGSMCLLNALESWTEDGLVCNADNHRDLAHPMRSASGLLAPCAIEYAAQAMALHGALLAENAPTDPTSSQPTPGFLASVRNVSFSVDRLDTVPGMLRIKAQRLSGTGNQLLYAFQVSDEVGRALVGGRAVVVINTPLPSAASPLPAP